MKNCSKCVSNYDRRNHVFFPFAKRVVFCSLTCWNNYLNNSCVHCGSTINRKTSFNCMRLSGTIFRFCNETCYTTFTTLNKESVFDAIECGAKNPQKFEFNVRIKQPACKYTMHDDFEDVQFEKNGPPQTALFDPPKYNRIYV